jgi:hypothetical protein
VWQALAPPLPDMQSLQDLWSGFNATRVIFLDLNKMELQPETGLMNVGPRGCLAGDMHMVPGQMGASSQVPYVLVHGPKDLYMFPKAAISLI